MCWASLNTHTYIYPIWQEATNQRRHPRSHQEHPGRSLWALRCWLAQLSFSPHTHHDLPPRRSQSMEEAQDTRKPPFHWLWPPSLARTARILGAARQRPCGSLQASGRRGRTLPPSLSDANHSPRLPPGISAGHRLRGAAGSGPGPRVTPRRLSRGEV